MTPLPGSLIESSTSHESASNGKNIFPLHLCMYIQLLLFYFHSPLFFFFSSVTNHYYYIFIFTICSLWHPNKNTNFKIIMMVSPTGTMTTIPNNIFARCHHPINMFNIIFNVWCLYAFIYGFESFVILMFLFCNIQVLSILPRLHVSYGLYKFPFFPFFIFIGHLLPYKLKFIALLYLMTSI